MHQSMHTSQTYYFQAIAKKSVHLPTVLLVFGAVDALNTLRPQSDTHLPQQACNKHLNALINNTEHAHITNILFLSNSKKISAFAYRFTCVWRI